MSDRVSDRALAIEASPTLVVDARAKALKAAGEPVIGFGAGEPDFATPDHIIEAAAKACHDPASHRYSPAAGQPALRAAVADVTVRDRGFAVDPGQVVITNGGKHALHNVFQALLDPGDQVLIPAPYWVSYPEQVKLAGGAPVAVPTSADGGFRANVDQLEAARTSRTKALVFVSPSNPTGTVYPRDAVEAVGRWAAQHGIWVISDEIYDHLIYGDARFSSLPALVPEVRDHAVIINGVSKTYAMTGWRVGWSIAPYDLSVAMAKLQSQVTSNVTNVAQAAALAALTGPQGAVEAMRQAFDRRRRTALDLLTAIPGTSCVEPEGAFYLFPSFQGVVGRTVAGRTIGSTLDLAAVALEAAKVAFVPGEAFGAAGFARLSYALADADLAEGLQRLASLLADAT